MRTHSSHDHPDNCVGNTSSTRDLPCRQTSPKQSTRERIGVVHSPWGGLPWGRSSDTSQRVLSPASDVYSNGSPKQPQSVETHCIARYGVFCGCAALKNVFLPESSVPHTFHTPLLPHISHSRISYSSRVTSNKRAMRGGVCCKKLIGNRPSF